MIVALVTLGLIVGAIIIHYEVLCWLSKLIPALAIKHRYRLLAGISAALVAHILEIGLFALGYYCIIRLGGGELVGAHGDQFLTCLYYSFVTYTTLGFGDLIPLGGLRFLTGLEALTGLVLITWTASFMYIGMQKGWYDETEE